MPPGRVLKQTHVEAASEVYCRLIDPLSDEEAQVEILMPVQAPAVIPRERDSSTVAACPVRGDRNRYA